MNPEENHTGGIIFVVGVVTVASACIYRMHVMHTSTLTDDEYNC